MVRLALRSALSDRAAEGRVALVDDWDFEVPRTKDAVAALEALGLDGRVLVVLGPDDGFADRSFANLPHVQTIVAGELNAYDILVNDWIVFTNATLPGAEVTVIVEIDEEVGADGEVEAVAVVEVVEVEGEVEAVEAVEVERIEADDEAGADADRVDDEAADAEADADGEGES
jgi:large subunit ribosomal protein L4